MNEIKIYLKTSGRIAELYKDFDLYEGCYRNSQMSVYVPKSLLYENEDGTFANLVKTGAILTAPNGKKLTTKSYYLDYVKTETVVGIAYAVYTIITPKEFCVYAGTQTVVVNVESIDNTDKDNQKVISVTTTQTANLIVLESAYLGQDEPIEPTELDKIKATLTEIEGEIDENTQNISELTSDVDNLSIQVSDLSENKLDKVSGNTTYKQAYAKDTNGDQIMQNYSTENVTNAIVQRDETGNIKITPGREGYMNDGATMRNIADVESEVAKKYDKTGGTIDGNVTVTGDLTVQGTTITENAETLDVKANVITTNSEGVPLINLSGLGIRTDATNVYGIMYDPQNDSVKLGLGSLDEDNNFTFNQGEGLPIAVRDDSAAFTDKHVIIWDAAGDKFVDGGKAVSDLPTLAGNNDFTGENTFEKRVYFKEIHFDDNDYNTYNAYANNQGFYAQYTDDIQYNEYKIKEAGIYYYGIGTVTNSNDICTLLFPDKSGTFALTDDIPTDYATQTALANTQRQVDGLYTLLEQKNEIYVQTATDTYTTRETAGGENIADGVQTPVKKITGKTVKTANLIPYPYAKGTDTLNGVTFTVNNDGTIIANGTATENAIFVFRDFDFSLSAGTYTISGLENGGADTYCLQISRDNYAESWNLYNGNIQIELKNTSSIILQYVVYKGTTVNNVVLKPMLNEGSTALSYMPYFPGLKNAFFKEIVSTGRNLFSAETAIPYNNCTYENGVVKQISADSADYYTWKIQFFKDSTFLTQSDVLFPQTGTIPALTIEKPSEANLLFLGLNGRERDTLMMIDVSNFPNGKYTATWNVLNITQGSVSWNNIMLNYGSSALPYEPYTQSVLSLPEAVELTEYDTAYPETGEIQRQSETDVFNGTETWNDYSDDTRFIYTANLSKGAVKTTTDVVCNLYPTAPINGVTLTGDNGKVFTSIQVILSKSIYPNLSASTAWKSQLAAWNEAGNPLTVTYKTAEVQSTEQANFSADSYIAWKNGSETIEQGNTDNSIYGAENTVDQDYYLLTAPEEVTKE